MSGLMPDAFGHDPSATSAFAALPDMPVSEKPKKKLKAVVVGGGTGAPVSIRTLLSMGVATDAVVAMADDGGSTGILRDQAGATAPGDIRKCITAMAGCADDPLTQAFKMRFGFAENHTLGNLMLSALEVTSGGFPEAIEICEKLLNARGERVVFTGDGIGAARELLEETLTVEHVFMPAHMAFPRASAAAVLALDFVRDGKTVSAAAEVPDYLRASQAEREFEKRTGMTVEEAARKARDGE